MRGADVLAHLNDEEAAAFKTLLPEKRHELVYPAVPPIAPGAGGDDLIIVASANYANYLGLAWFLQEVLPLAPDEVAAPDQNHRQYRRRRPRPRAGALQGAMRELFLGHVKDLGAAYANAAAVLLPTTEGHGVSIKTIEAMSSGAPLIATPHAFRGMRLDPARARQRHARRGRAGFRGGHAAGGGVAARSGEPAGGRHAEILSKPFRFRGLSRRAGATRFAAFETREYLI